MYKWLNICDLKLMNHLTRLKHDDDGVDSDNYK